VTSRPIDQPLAQELLSLSEALDRQGIAYTTEVLSAGVHPVPDAIAPRLEVLPGTAVFQLHRRRAVADEPVAVLHNYVRLDRCPGIDTKDFRERQLFAVLRADFQIEIEEAARGFQAQAASKEVAEQLMIAEGVPVLYLDQVSYGKTGEPIEYSDVWIRGDKLRLSSWLVRQERR
jgi:GntR family transcriptional regulator